MRDHLQLEFRIFGPFETWQNGHLVRAGRRRERCLLGILLLDAGSAVPADRLASLLWDEAAPEDPRAALHTYVSRLRSALRPGGGTVPEIQIVRSGGSYRVDVSADAVDTLRFRLLVNQARGLSDPVERARVLRAAAELRRGPLLADVATEGVRDRLGIVWEEAWLAAREEAIDAELACGAYRELIGELITLAAEYPFRERFTDLLMRALYRSGRTADALAAYARIERRMRTELGIEISASLRQLHAQILHSDPLLDRS